MVGREDGIRSLGNVRRAIPVSQPGENFSEDLQMSRVRLFYEFDEGGGAWLNAEWTTYYLDRVPPPDPNEHSSWKERLLTELSSSDERVREEAAWTIVRRELEDDDATLAALRVLEQQVNRGVIDDRMRHGSLHGVSARERFDLRLHDGRATPELGRCLHRPRCVTGNSPRQRAQLLGSCGDRSDAAEFCLRRRTSAVAGAGNPAPKKSRLIARNLEGQLVVSGSLPLDFELIPIAQRVVTVDIVGTNVFHFSLRTQN